MMNKNWVFEKKLSDEELELEIYEFNHSNCGTTYIHKKSGGFYLIVGCGILSYNDKSELAVHYYAIKNDKIINEVLHVRPASEFFDGRFEIHSLNSSDAEIIDLMKDLKIN